MSNKSRPKLADVSCQKMQFSPGDRILIRTYSSLSKEQKRRLERTFQKWAGCDLDVLIYDATQMEVTIERGQPRF